MNDEDDFQRMLDANPADHTTRLVFADWLQERDDPRAEGYRALGVLRVFPDLEHADGGSWNYASPRGHDGESPCDLPGDWFKALAPSSTYWSDDCDTRREAEDAAALAFSRLPAARRAELLGLPAAEAA